MFEILTKKFTDYICTNKSKELSNLFALEGVYHDYIYGSFKGRKNVFLSKNSSFTLLL